MPRKEPVLTIYGIPNCDTCRKARKWLDANRIEYHFHNVREAGVDMGMLERWADAADWLKLLNTRSTTWRSIAESDRQDLSKARALALMLEHPTLIKRPVLETADVILVGFSAGSYESRLT